MGGGRYDLDTETFIARPLRAQAQPSHRLNSDTYVAHTLRGGGFDASEDGTGRGTPLIALDLHNALETQQLACTLGTESAHGNRGPAIAFDTTQITSRENRSNPQPDAPAPALARTAHPPAIAFHATQTPIAGEVATAMGCGGPRGCGAPGVAYALRSDAGREGVAKTASADADGRVRLRDPGFTVEVDRSPTLDAARPHTIATLPAERPHGLHAGMAVRRLTPRECERLQGLPDDYTLVPWRSGRGSMAEALAPKRLREPTTEDCPDGPRYRAIGNSMAVVVMEWIGRRIAAVDASWSGVTP